MSILEILAAICGLWCVGLMIARSVWGWPVGLAQVLLYTKVFYDAGLYSQTLLQIIFALLQLHGWWQWKQTLQSGTGQPAERIEVETLSLAQVSVAIVAAMIVSLTLGILMQTLTTAKWPIADATITGLSLVAQWLLIQRKLENWLFWIAVNILSIIVFTAQGLWPTVGLYIVFLFMAIQGWLTWRCDLPVAATSS